MKKNSQKIIGTIIALIVLVITIILATPKVTKMIRISKITDPEILTAMTYDQFTDDDKKVDNCDYVEFSAFFTRDLDDDGYAEKIKGTCRELSQTDTLYAEINVLTQGHLDGGKITLNGNNFTWNTAIVEDSIVEGDYIGETKEIKLKSNLNPGSQKLLWGTIKSKIGNNKNDYSKVNSITLTGTYYDDEGNATEINKTIEFPVDWYGETKTEVNKYYYSLYNFESYQNQILDIATIVKENSIDLSFKVAVSETKQKLLLKKQEAQITIPELNGYKPIEVLVDEKNIDKNYNEETGILTITRNAEEDDNGVITKTVAKSNIYNVTVKYPLEAYDQMTADSVVLNIPVKGINEGYNNPGTEFSNPHISTAEGILTVTYSKPSGKIWNIYPTVGNNERVSGAYTTFRYQISKEVPTDIFNGDVYEDKTTIYPVRWEVVIGDYTSINKINLQEQDENENKKSDEFLSTSNTYSSMYDYITTTGVYFEQASSALGSDGWIKIYNDETDSLLETFNSSTWERYNKDNPYSVNIKSLRIETSKPIANTSFSVYQIKEVDDELITESFSQEEFDKLSFVYTYLKGTIEAPDGVTYDNGLATSEINKSNYAYYDAPYSVATLIVDPNQITNQKTENVTFKITTSSQNMLEKEWINGTFVIELPDSVINASVNGVEISDENVQLSSCDVIEENGKYFIKIYTKNEEEKLYTITVNASISGNPLNHTENKSVNLYSYNENCNNYYNKSADLYDLDNDGLTNDNIGYNSVGLSLIAPSGLLTTEYVTDYDDEGSTTIAPNIADIEKSDETRTANINVSITNSYSGTISDIVILGKIPYEGNTYVINGGDLNSKFTANITGAIIVPENLRDATSVYYSTKENPTKDLNEETNGWILAENVTDWNEVRTYLIDMGTYNLAKEKNEVFTYEVKVPAGLGYNTASFSSHAVYYNLDTENGKLAVKTEPNKVGVQIVEKYNLELTKNRKEYDDILVPGAIYSVTTTDVDGNPITKVATTNSEGILTFNGLYVEKEYKLKEISVQSDYVISDEELVFEGRIDNSGNLAFDVKQGKFKEIKDSENNIVSSVEITIDQNDNYLVKASIEDEIKYTLKIKKIDENNNPISKVKFLINGNNINKTIKTDENGEIIIKGLYPDEEYGLLETQADGYYVNESPRTFKIIRNDNGILELNIDNTESLSYSINETAEENQAIISFNITNEKIPTFDLQIVKVEENFRENNLENLRKLEGAQFLIESIDTGDQMEVVTDENGTIVISDLYQYIEGKNITGRYKIRETKAPNGYSNNGEEIEFYCIKKDDGNLELEIENKENLSSYKYSLYDNDIVKIVIQDKTLFKLTKVDSESIDENGNPILLPGAEFVIYEITDDGNIIDYAKDVNGIYVGNLNENNQYTVITGEDGTIAIPLRSGIYKAVEVGYPEGYIEGIQELVFRIEKNKNESEVIEYNDSNGYSEIVTINCIEDLVELSQNVNNGQSYNNILVKLNRDLDFNNPESYNNSMSMEFGDINCDGNVDSILDELVLETGCGFTPIGNGDQGFQGVFDGQGHQINNIYINASNINYVGLFGFITGYAQICNVKVDGNINYYGESYCVIGGLCGWAHLSQIRNCSSNCQINLNSNRHAYVGGVVGSVSVNTLIMNCYNEGDIICNDSLTNVFLGGICGDASNSKFMNCYNTADLSSEAQNLMYVGGILGYCGSNLSIDNCYNVGNIICDNNKDSYVGGIVGIAGASNNIQINNVYYSDSCSIEGQTKNNYGIVKSEDEMKGSTFVNVLSSYAWKNDELNTNEGFPVLKVSTVEFINTIEDLIDFEISVNSGNTYYNKIVKLERNLDFLDSASYQNSLRTDYGDINGNNIIESLIEELTNVDGLGFTPIGINEYNPFSGIFDGNNHIIDNLYINSNSQCSGFFAYIHNGKIRNLSISGEINSSVEEMSYVGGIVGYMKDGYYSFSNSSASTYLDNSGIEAYTTDNSVINCYNKANIKNVSKGGYLGGIVGYNSIYSNGNDIYLCGNEGNIENHTDKTSNIGGILGSGYRVRKSYNRGNILECNNSDSQVKDYVGGIVGDVKIIENCVNEGNISFENHNTESDYIGGITGSVSISIADCTNLGCLDIIDCGSLYAGGIVGYTYVDISKCNNKGEIKVNIDGAKVCVAGICGYISDRVKLDYCSNTGNIISNVKAESWNTNNYNYVGGIVARTGSNNNINYCYNSGMISSNSTYIASSIGGIVGYIYISRGTINCCYNSGNIESDASFGANSSINSSECVSVGGIVGTGSSNITNCYNTGDFDNQSNKYSYSGGIIGKGSPSTITNIYNVGNIISSTNSKYSKAGYIIGSNNINSVQNIYYLDSSEIQSYTIYNSGKAVSDFELKTDELYQNLNRDGVWFKAFGRYPTLYKLIVSDVSDVNEIIVENTIKKYDITTDINETNGVKGGYISGEDENPYERIVINEMNIKPIEIIPDADYGISSITVNGLEIEYAVDELGKVVLDEGYFSNINEDKKIIVTFTPLDQILVINKVDESNSDLALANAEFKIETIENRTTDGKIGEIVENGKGYNPILEHTLEKRNDLLGSLVNNGDYYFVENNGKYNPNNLDSSLYSSVAASYMELDLTNNPGEFKLVVNAGSNAPVLSVRVTEDTNQPDPVSSNNALIFNTGDNIFKDYSCILTGNKKYYLHFVFINYSHNNWNVQVNSVDLYKVNYTNNELTGVVSDLVNNGTYYFVEEDGRFIPNNINNQNTTAYSYMEIDLTNYSDYYIVAVDASANTNAPLGVGISENINQKATNICYLYNGNYDRQRYYYTIQGGKKYYLHLSYIYYASNTFPDGQNAEIYDVKVFNTSTDKYSFVEKEGKYVSNNSYLYNTTANSYIPIDLTDTWGKYNLNINAELSTGRDGRGYVTITKDTTAPLYSATNGRLIYMTSTQNATEYTTVLESGYVYYVHLGFDKGNGYFSGTETFTINNIELSLNTDDYINEIISTNESGIIRKELPINSYRITEVKAPKGYTLDSTPRTVEVGPGQENSITITNKHKTGLLVHHYFKDKTKEGAEQYTTLKVAEDEFSEGDINQDYTTSPRFDLDNLYLEKSEDGKYITPANASGKFGDSLIEVNYYYELEPIELKINHYLEGTTDAFADEKIEEFLSKLEFDEEGNYQIKTDGSYKINSNEDYNNLINDRYELVKIESTVNPNLNADDTLSFTENAELTYYYKLKEHKITTEVKPHVENRTNEVTNEKEESIVKGGKITGEEAEVYEIVENGENSEKIIKAIPDEGYVITKITLDSSDGEEAIQTVLLDIDNNIEEPSADAEISYTKNADGSVTFSTFDNVTADKHIIVEFNVVPGTVAVHHYIRGTGEEYGVDPVRPVLEDGVTECEDEIKNDYIGELYATKANENISKRYKLVLTSGETSGTYTDEVKHVYYYYDLDDFPYSVHYFYNEVENEEYVENGEKLRYGSLVTEYEDKADGYVFDKVEPADSLDETKTKLMITEKEEQNVINVYYLSDVNIETEVITHTETYKDGTVVEGVKGGNVYEIYNDTETKEYEKETILFSKDSQKEIIIVPDEGYVVGAIRLVTDDGEINVDVNALLLEDGKVVLNSENGYFKDLRNDVKVEVDFRKKSKIIVKYLAQNEFDEEGNNLVLATEEIIDGYESKVVEPENKFVKYYVNANPIITDEDNNEIEPEVIMTADEQTVIYWYEKAKSGVVVRHIEITEEDIRKGLTLDSGTILDIEQKEGEVLSEDIVYRKVYSYENGVVENEKYKNYISVDGPKSYDEVLFIESKDENSQEVIYPEDMFVEVRFYYMRQYKISTEVKTHDEYGYDIKGGTISGESDEIYEYVNKKGSNQKEIVIQPDEGYKIKTITVNGVLIDYSDLIDEENKVVLDANYFKDIIEDKHIIVEFEKEITIEEDGGTEEIEDDSTEEFIEKYENINRIKDIPTGDYIIKDLIIIAIFIVIGIILIYKKNK